jgi:hypothetical protein
MLLVLLVHQEGPISHRVMMTRKRKSWHAQGNAIIRVVMIK